MNMESEGMYMRNLLRYVEECKEELDSLNIEYGNVISWTINTRATRRWGQCKRKGSDYAINISEILLDERNDVKGLKETIIHELLHTISGCMNHGEKWQMYANEVNACLGYEISRISTMDEKGLCEECKQVREEEYKKQYNARPIYRLICKECGNTYTYHRAGYYVQHYKDCWCHLCKGKFDLIKG